MSVTYTVGTTKRNLSITAIFLLAILAVLVGTGVFAQAPASVQLTTLSAGDV